MPWWASQSPFGTEGLSLPAAIPQLGTVQKGPSQLQRSLWGWRRCLLRLCPQPSSPSVPFLSDFSSLGADLESTPPSNFLHTTLWLYLWELNCYRNWDKMKAINNLMALSWVSCVWKKKKWFRLWQDFLCLQIWNQGQFQLIILKTLITKVCLFIQVGYLSLYSEWYINPQKGQF